MQEILPGRHPASHHTFGSGHLAVVGFHRAGIALAKCGMDLSQFFSSEYIVVVHIVHVDTLTLSVAKGKRGLHNLHPLVDGGVLYQYTFHRCCFCRVPIAAGKRPVQCLQTEWLKADSPDFRIENQDCCVCLE